MSRSSAKIRDHASKILTRSIDLRPAYRKVMVSGICFRFFPARRGQLSIGVPWTPLNPRGTR